MLRLPMNGVKWGIPKCPIVSLSLKVTPYLGTWKSLAPLTRVYCSTTLWVLLATTTVLVPNCSTSIIYKHKYTMKKAHEWTVRRVP